VPEPTTNKKDREELSDKVREANGRSGGNGSR
jgi:hypothetical protein